MMRCILFLSAIVSVCALLAVPSMSGVDRIQLRDQSMRFVTADVVIDSPSAPLAAWQVEIVGTLPGGSVELVGVEGSPDATSPFSKPAYYDPAALQGNRVILGTFSTIPPAGLPRGKAVVARLHFAVTGNAQLSPSLKTSLITAADHTGAVIQPTCTIQLGDRP